MVREMKTSVVAIFDVGKTNKKLFLFDENYRIVFEQNDTLPETTDEDGYPCEDLDALSAWTKSAWQMVNMLPEFAVKAVNFSGYGASFVHLDGDLKPITPLYNYLKPYPEALQKQFYDTYGGQDAFAVATASPVLGSLNSGMQLYRLKYEQPAIFAQIKYSLHLPQYLSFLISGQCTTDITSIGSHTNLWDFQKNQYHDWVEKEEITPKLPPIVYPPNYLNNKLDNQQITTGAGLHDSSAALVPYLATFSEPFLLISTGTWSITLNAFSNAPLTIDELGKDCLNYLTFEGKAVKASRLFLGKEHEEGVEKLSKMFNKSNDYFKNVTFNAAFLTQNTPATFEGAYHQLVAQLVQKQVQAVYLAKGNTAVRRLFVDGGFSKNTIYMKLLASQFADCEVYAASMAQASALGAAIVLHDSWNPKPLQNDLIELIRF